MANAATHTSIGAISGLTVSLMANDEGTAINPLLALGTSAAFSSLPDILEPAFKNPHHRQFCHSFALLGGIAYALMKLYEWEPQKEEGKLIRTALLCAGTGYASHLVLDAFTSRSLPFIGKI